MRSALLAIALLVGCSPDPCDEEGACECAVERRLPDGTCCLGFTRPDRGVCAARTWILPDLGDAWGEPGAAEVAVAVDSESRGVAAWVAPSDDRRVVVIAEEHENAWSLQEPAGALEGEGTAPSLAAGPEGEVLVAWKQALPQPPDATEPVDDSYLSRRRTDGTWMHPGPQDALSLPPSGYDPRPFLAPWGEAIVVWNQWSGDSSMRSSPGYGVAIARRAFDAEADTALSRPAEADDVLSAPVANSNEPRIAAGANGDALVVWYQAATQDGELMVYASERYRVDGDFDRPAVDAFLSPAGTNAGNPVPAVGERGHAAVVWVQDNGRGAKPIYLATRDGFGDWTVPPGLEHAFCIPRGVAAGAQVVFGRDGALFVVWSQGDPLGGKQVFAARRNTAGAWDEPGLEPTRLSSPEHDALDPSIAVGPHGEVIVVWSERLDGSRRRIASRRRNAGADRWSEIDVLSPDDGHDAEHPAVAIGATGRAVVAWEQGPAGRARVRFASID